MDALTIVGLASALLALTFLSLALRAGWKIEHRHHVLREQERGD